MLLANRQNLYANVAGSWLREELGHTSFGNGLLRA